FEGHVFHRLTAGRFGRSHPDLSHPRWNPRRYARTPAGEWERLDRAAQLDATAALQSASWGAFQIMGFNYALCGFDSIGRFVECQSTSAEAQLEAFATLLGRPGSPLLAPLRRRDWARFARLYNGPEYRRNRYDDRLAAAYARHAGTAPARARRPTAPARPAPGRPEPAPLELLETAPACRGCRGHAAGRWHAGAGTRCQRQGLARLLATTGCPSRRCPFVTAAV